MQRRSSRLILPGVSKKKKFGTLYQNTLQVRARVLQFEQPVPVLGKLPVPAIWNRSQTVTKYQCTPNCNRKGGGVSSLT